MAACAGWRRLQHNSSAVGVQLRQRIHVHSMSGSVNARDIPQRFKRKLARRRCVGRLNARGVGPIVRLSPNSLARSGCWRGLGQVFRLRHQARSCEPLLRGATRRAGVVGRIGSCGGGVIRGQGHRAGLPAATRAILHQGRGRRVRAARRGVARRPIGGSIISLAQSLFARLERRKPRVVATRAWTHGLDGLGRLLRLRPVP
mmetsp:Transcript_3229/g.6328  ORF Transcript_3229/g.6328 Transcript_3229/m.6328 type:complete len:202 (+) Transcript_3229:1606-2211(+)